MMIIGSSSSSTSTSTITTSSSSSSTAPDAGRPAVGGGGLRGRRTSVPVEDNIR